MKRIPVILLFISVLFFSGVNSFAQDYWLHVNSPTERILTKCIFPDSVYGWAAGDSGTIVHTTNSGSTWQLQNSGVLNYNIDDIFFLNRRLGWALANDYLFIGSIVLTTTNGGLNWSQSRFPDSNYVVTNIYYTDSLSGYATGFSGKVYRTTNGGSNWTECVIDTAGCPLLYGFPKNRINFINSNTGYLAGGKYDIVGVVWRTTNAGVNWSTFCLTPEPLFDVQHINADKIIACGGDFEFGAITTTTFNNTASWRYLNTGLFGVARDLAFRTEKEVWMPLSFAQAWAVHLDSCNQNVPWISIPAPDSTAVYAAKFLSPTLGFAFGSYGAILKYNTAIIGITPGSNIVPKSSSLGQNYPNPFNPSTNITYTLAKGDFVNITIYDITGRRVKVFVEGYRPAGTNHFRFVNFGLASGVYIYKIDAGKFTESKRMVIVK